MELCIWPWHSHQTLDEPKYKSDTMLKERRQHSLLQEFSNKDEVKVKEEQITLSQKQGFLSCKSQRVSFRVLHSGGCAELKSLGTRVTVTIVTPQLSQGQI